MFADGPPPGTEQPAIETPRRLDGAGHPDGGVPDDSIPRQPETSLRRHQGFLVARVEGNKVAALLGTLAEGEQAFEAGFVARLDGDAHGYYFFFDARLGARPAETLGAAFGAAGIEVSLGVVADVRSLDELVRDARAAAAAAGRTSAGRSRDQPAG